MSAGLQVVSQRGGIYMYLVTVNASVLIDDLYINSTVVSAGQPVLHLNIGFDVKVL